MKLLAIDTSGEACSAALCVDSCITVQYAVEPRRHGELILTMMDQLLAEAGLVLSQLDALAFGRGPGAFTGVRIATGVAQGAAFGAGLPVVPVSTLAALAQRHYREHGKCNCLVAIDARMDEVYWGTYRVDDAGFATPVVDDQVAAPELVTLPPNADWHGVGSGWASYPERLQQRVGNLLASVTPQLMVSAHDVAILGAAGLRTGTAVPPSQALPVYLRDRVAQAARRTKQKT